MAQKSHKVSVRFRNGSTKAYAVKGRKVRDRVGGRLAERVCRDAMRLGTTPVQVKWQFRRQRKPLGTIAL